MASKLFEPYTLKGRELPNRVVWLPHITYFAVGGRVSDQMVAYYEERAKSGVGMIIMGCESVSPHYPNPVRISAWDPDVVPGYRTLSGAVQRHGTVLVGQLTEDGNQNFADVTLDWDYEYGASAVADWAVDRIPKVMEHEDIARSVGYWACAAVHQQEGGFDGTELKVGHDGILRQFLSPYYNRRTDEYGGSRENRLRFLREVLDAIRAKVGPDYLVGLRFVLAEYVDGGYELDEGVAMLREVERWGTVDYVTSDLGVHTALRFCNPPMATPQGFAREAFSEAHRAVGLPLIGYGRIKTPELAEEVLERGEADLVGMARALIADPQWVEKVRDGRAAEIRMCIGCNQGCLDRIWRGQQLTCILNPGAGREEAWGIGTLERAELPKLVLVVGGGPAGMKAAEIAAARGHRVVLFDRQRQLGGAVNTLVRVPVRQEFHDSTAHLEARLRELDVRVKLGYEVLAVAPDETGDGSVAVAARQIGANGDGDVETFVGDAVVVATGSKPLRPEFLADDDPRVLTVEEALEPGAALGRRVVIADSEGGYSSTATAEFLAQQGHEVTLATSMLDVGILIGPPGRQVQLPALVAAGVDIRPQLELTGADWPTLSFRHVLSGREVLLEADTLVLTTGRAPDDELYRTLAAAFEDVIRIGDCVAPRDVGMAVYMGEKVGREL